MAAVRWGADLRCRHPGPILCGPVPLALPRDWGAFPELARNSIWPWPSVAVLHLTVSPAPAGRSARRRTLQRTVVFAVRAGSLTCGKWMSCALMHDERAVPRSPRWTQDQPVRYRYM
jgi:hypothetical protein